MGGDEVPAALDQLGVSLGAGQQLAVVGPVHMPLEEGRGMGDAHRGHGIQQAEKLHAHLQARQLLLGRVRPLGHFEQLAQPVDEGARLRRPAGKAIDIQLDLQWPGGGRRLLHLLLQGFQ
ncbi:hypothetical protein D9M69_537030 [compost metagenome]